MADNAKFSEEMKTLREYIENEKAKQAAKPQGSAELDAILERLEKEDFTSFRKTQNKKDFPTA